MFYDSKVKRRRKKHRLDDIIIKMPSEASSSLCLRLKKKKKIETETR